MKWSDWKTSGPGDGDHDADEQRDRREGHEQRGEDAVPAVALPASRRRAGGRPRGSRRSSTHSRIVRISKRNARAAAMASTVSVTVAVAPAIRDDPHRRSPVPGCRPSRSSRPSDVSVTSPCGMTPSSGNVWIQSWRQLGPRRDERASAGWYERDMPSGDSRPPERSYPARPFAPSEAQSLIGLGRPK